MSSSNINNEKQDIGKLFQELRKYIHFLATLQNNYAFKNSLFCDKKILFVSTYAVRDMYCFKVHHNKGNELNLPRKIACITKWLLKIKPLNSLLDYEQLSLDVDINKQANAVTKQVLNHSNTDLHNKSTYINEYFTLYYVFGKLKINIKSFSPIQEHLIYDFKFRMISARSLTMIYSLLHTFLSNKSDSELTEVNDIVESNYNS